TCTDSYTNFRFLFPIKRNLKLPSPKTPAPPARVCYILITVPGTVIILSSSCIMKARDFLAISLRQACFALIRVWQRSDPCQQNVPSSVHHDVMERRRAMHAFAARMKSHPTHVVLLIACLLLFTISGSVPAFAADQPSTWAQAEVTEARSL